MRGKRNVDASEVASGFLNRFMHFGVRSPKALSFGSEFDEVDFTEVTEQLWLALRFGRVTERVRFGADARELWPEDYAQLRHGHHGLSGEVTARAGAHVVRLALIYTLLDRADTIRDEHLRAALAVWEYSDQSARWCYGRALGDPLADELWQAISGRPDGMTRTAIRDHFSRNKHRHDINNALRPARPREPDRVSVHRRRRRSGDRNVVSKDRRSGGEVNGTGTAQRGRSSSRSSSP